MPNRLIPDSQKALNAGISLPPDLIRVLSRTAFGQGRSKSALAQEILRQHFARAQRMKGKRPAKFTSSAIRPSFP